MDLIDAGTAALGEWVGARMGEGPLASLVVDGIIAGLGGVVVFLPQILVLFAFIPGAGGIGLPAARGVPARPDDGRRRPVRPLVHPAAVQLRLCHPGDHGHPQHPGPA